MCNRARYLCNVSLSTCTLYSVHLPRKISIWVQHYTCIIPIFRVACFADVRSKSAQSLVITAAPRHPFLPTLYPGALGLYNIEGRAELINFSPPSSRLMHIWAMHKSNNF